MTKSIYDKTRWPLQTPDLFWALSDNLEDIGSLRSCDDNFADYEIDTSFTSECNILNHINALRNITLKMSCFLPVLRKCIRYVSLCLGSQTLQCVQKNDDCDITFTMFTGENLLPLFILKEEKLTVRIEFEYLDSNKKALIPYKCIDANGLLVRIKTMRKEFFVGACNQSILVWNGKECKIQTAAANYTAAKNEDSKESPFGPPKIRKSKFLLSPTVAEATIDFDSIGNFSDLWDVLRSDNDHISDLSASE